MRCPCGKKGGEKKNNFGSVILRAIAGGGCGGSYSCRGARKTTREGGIGHTHIHVRKNVGRLLFSFDLSRVQTSL